MFYQFLKLFPFLSKTCIDDSFPLEPKTLQSMLTSVKKGKPVNEEEIPPPVALGGKARITAESEPIREQEVPQPALLPSPPTNQKPLREAAPAAPNTKPLHLTPPQKPAVTPGTPAISPLTPSQPDTQHSGQHTRLNSHYINFIYLPNYLH